MFSRFLRLLCLRTKLPDIDAPLHGDAQPTTLLYSTKPPTSTHDHDSSPRVNAPATDRILENNPNSDDEQTVLAVGSAPPTSTVSLQQPIIPAQRATTQSSYATPSALVEKKLPPIWSPEPQNDANNNRQVVPFTAHTSLDVDDDQSTAQPISRRVVQIGVAVFSVATPFTELLTPLKAAVGGVLEILKIIDKSQSNREFISNFLTRADNVQNMLKAFDSYPPSAMNTTLAGIIRNLIHNVDGLRKRIERHRDDRNILQVDMVAGIIRQAIDDLDYYMSQAALQLSIHQGRAAQEMMDYMSRSNEESQRVLAAIRQDNQRLEILVQNLHSTMLRSMIPAGSIAFVDLTGRTIPVPLFAAYAMENFELYLRLQMFNGDDPISMLHQNVLNQSGEYMLHISTSSWPAEPTSIIKLCVYRQWIISPIAVMFSRRGAGGKALWPLVLHHAMRWKREVPPKDSDWVNNPSQAGDYHVMFDAISCDVNKKSGNWTARWRVRLTDTVYNPLIDDGNKFDEFMIADPICANPVLFESNPDAQKLVRVIVPGASNIHKGVLAMGDAFRQVTPDTFRGDISTFALPPDNKSTARIARKSLRLSEISRPLIVKTNNLLALTAT